METIVEKKIVFENEILIYWHENFSILFYNSTVIFAVQIQTQTWSSILKMTMSAVDAFC